MTQKFLLYDMELYYIYRILRAKYVVKINRNVVMGYIMQPTVFQMLTMEGRNVTFDFMTAESMTVRTTKNNFICDLRHSNLQLKLTIWRQLVDSH